MKASPPGWRSRSSTARQTLGCIHRTSMGRLFRHRPTMPVWTRLSGGMARAIIRPGASLAKCITATSQLPMWRKQKIKGRGSAISVRKRPGWASSMRAPRPSAQDGVFSAECGRSLAEGVRSPRRAPPALRSRAVGARARLGLARGGGWRGVRSNRSATRLGPAGFGREDAQEIVESQVAHVGRHARQMAFYGHQGCSCRRPRLQAHGQHALGSQAEAARSGRPSSGRSLGR